jgi:hypothetical protein
MMLKGRRVGNPALVTFRVALEGFFVQLMPVSLRMEVREYSKKNSRCRHYDK